MFYELTIRLNPFRGFSIVFSWSSCRHPFITFRKMWVLAANFSRDSREYPPTQSSAGNNMLLWKYVSTVKTRRATRQNYCHIFIRRSKRKYFATSMTMIFAHTDAKRMGAARVRSVSTTRKRLESGSKESARKRPNKAKSVEPRR